MADMPRSMFGARLPDGTRLGGPAKALCAFLWGYVAAAAKMRRPGPHFVFHDRLRLADAMDVGTRAIDDHLQQLRELGAVVAGVHEGRYGFWLHTPPGLEDEGQPADDRSPSPTTTPTRSLGDRAPGRSAGDRRSNSQEIADRSRGRSSIDRAEIVDRSRGRSSIDRAEIVDRSRTSKEEQEVKQEYEQELSAAAAAAAGRAPASPEQQAAAPGSDPQAEARSLLTELRGPLAALDPEGVLSPLSPGDPTATTLLAELLAVAGGSPADHVARREHVRTTVLAFAAICVAEPGQRRWFAGGMFNTRRASGSPRSWWENNAFTVSNRRQLEQDGAAARKAAAERLAAAEREATELAARKPSTDEALLAVAADAPGGYAQIYAEVLTNRRQGEQREREAARLEAERAEAARKATREQGEVLIAARLEQAGDDLEALEQLGYAALAEHHAQVRRELATAHLVEDAEQVRRLTARKLEVARRLAALRGLQEAPRV